MRLCKRKTRGAEIDTKEAQRLDYIFCAEYGCINVVPEAYREALLSKAKQTSLIIE